MFRTGLASLLAVAAEGAPPTFAGTAAAGKPVSGAVVVPELASAPKSIDVYWALDSEGKTVSDTPVVSKAYSLAERRTCGDTGSVPAKSSGRGEVADPKVVNGADAEICELKWQAHLVESDGFHFCGATILSPKWLMTAAHCKSWTSDEGLKSIFVVVGDHSQKVKESHQVTRAIKKAIEHPEWDKAKFTGDYMLLELAEEIPFNSCIGAACLPSAAVPTGTDCLVSGWGVTEDGSTTSPDVLKVASVKSVSDGDCSKAYEGKAGFAFTKHMFCVQGGSAEEGIKGQCRGDSGGPVVCKNSDGKYDLHGASSGVERCGDAKYPDISAKIVTVLDWILATTGLAPNDAILVPIEGKTPPGGAVGLAVFAVDSAGKKTSLGVIAMASEPAVTKPATVSSSGRPSLSCSFFVLAAAARLWAAVN